MKYMVRTQHDKYLKYNSRGGCITENKSDVTLFDTYDEATESAGVYLLASGDSVSRMRVIKNEPLTKSVLLDIDGVIFNIMLGAKRYLKTLGYDIDLTKITDYKLSGNIGCDKSIIYSLFDTNKPYLYGSYYPDVVEYINRLKAHYIVEAYTGVTSDVSYCMRRKQLKVLGMSGGYIFRGNKPILNSYDIVIDDSIYVLNDWQKTDKRLFLVNSLGFYCDEYRPERCEIYNSFVDVAKLLIEEDITSGV